MHIKHENDEQHASIIEKDDTLQIHDREYKQLLKEFDDHKETCLKRDDEIQTQSVKLVAKIGELDAAKKKYGAAWKGLSSLTSEVYHLPPSSQPHA